jgi:hypothetical protein
MINELRTMNSEIISCCCFPADTKANPSLSTDKQTIQEVKTTGEEATQLKRQDSLTLLPDFPDEYAAADYCIRDWTFWVQYRGQ